MKPIHLGMATAGLLLAPAAAQAANEDEQLWLQTNTSVRLGEHWSLSNEANVRFSNARSGLYEVEDNLLLGYRLGKAVTLAAGYTHDPQYVGGSFTVMERRVREQISFDNVARIGMAALSLRLRAEQRWREGVVSTGWRLRPFARLALPLGKSRAQLVAGHESFVNLNGTGFQAVTGWERMRNNVALRVPIARTLSGEVGYLNQYTVVANGPDRIDHAATLSIGLSL